MQRSILSLFILFLISGCNNDDGQPGTAALIFPENNSECTAGVEIDSVTSRIPFEWEPSKRTDSYQLRVENLIDGNVQEFDTEATSLEVALQKGQPYSWNVTSIRQDDPETTQSETWKFYNGGDGVESYAPFPATAVSPKQDETVPVGGGTVALQWEGNDIDGDIAGYDVYFDSANPPETVIASDLKEAVLEGVDVSSKTVYYWKVITKDSQGNQSDSEVFAFKVN